MRAKYEWRIAEESIDLPRCTPQIIDPPEFNFISIEGMGSPDEKQFIKNSGALYSLAYSIRMLPKKMPRVPQGYFDFSVYPLEGLWHTNEKAKALYSSVVDKEPCVYQLMIRQPGFVDDLFFKHSLQLTKQRRRNRLLDKLQFVRQREGLCVQMLHLGPFENRAASFEKMEYFAKREGLVRVSKAYREIYVSDTRNSAPEKLRTVLRFQVKPSE